ncbi:patatin-like phospholipase family protein [Streptomyces odontomachi]|uniref:patatin-like phospholipase family protein n=1 Tax=Streptomyces odontomachi TaxID=2944940 RepID=UPI00210CE3E8|nr:patatin-like phospholipase family protein [Streptomyces sp. ODS25]
MPTSDVDGASEHWDPAHPVLEVLRARRASGSRPGQRDDGAKVALAVEGGGMRGVISAAMLTELEDYGFKDAFDVVYGCSSGGINGAYFLAGETWYPLSIYYDDLTTKKFVDFSRALRRLPILGLDYAFDHVMERVKPLDYEAVLRSEIPLAIPITDVDALQTVVLRDFASRSELKEALRASAWLPIAVPGTVQMADGRRAVDGGVLTALPFRLAINDGCTHVLSLSTRPMREPSDGFTLMHRYTRAHLERMSRGLGDGYLAAIIQKHSDQAWLHRTRTAPEADPAYVLDLAPLPWMTELKRHELRHHQLLENARTAYGIAFCATEGRPSVQLRRSSIRAMPKLTMVDTTDGQPQRFAGSTPRGVTHSDGVRRPAPDTAERSLGATAERPSGDQPAPDAPA